MSISRITFIFILSTSFFACSDVKPWQKGNFVKPQMAFDPDPLQTKFMRHTYESKEASFGGYGIAGAGCGCK